MLQHYSDVIVSAMASQIAGVSIVYSLVCSGANQRKHQSSASLAFVGNSPVTGEFPLKGHLRGKCFHFITLSCECCHIANLPSLPKPEVVITIPGCYQRRHIWRFDNLQIRLLINTPAGLKWGLLKHRALFSPWGATFASQRWSCESPKEKVKKS